MEPITSHSKRKMAKKSVSFGGTTVVCIPRRGRYSLSLTSEEYASPLDGPNEPTPYQSAAAAYSFVPPLPLSDIPHGLFGSEPSTSWSDDATEVPHAPLYPNHSSFESVMEGFTQEEVEEHVMAPLVEPLLSVGEEGGAYLSTITQPSSSQLELNEAIEAILGATPDSPEETTQAAEQHQTTTTPSTTESAAHNHNNTPTLEEEHEEVVPISPTSRRLSGEFDREDGDDLPHRVVADDGDESSRLVVAGPRTCIFCGSGARRPRRSSSFDWSTITRQDGMCFHPCCALWCPEVFYDEQHGVLRSLLYARMRCAPIKCAYCRKYGASVGCVEIDCQLSYHLPCALKAHASLGLEEFVLRCPRHTQP